MLDVKTHTGIPKKVLVHIHENHEVHNDCLSAGSDACCSLCGQQILESFDAIYGHHLTTEDVLLAIVSDLAEEIR